MEKVGRISYSVDVSKNIGVKTFILDLFYDESSMDFIMKAMITCSKIKEFTDRYAVLKGNPIYDFMSVLERAPFYSNLIYSFPFKAGDKGGVKMLLIRLDNDTERKQVRGVIALSFFSPVQSSMLSEKDRESVYYYFQPIQFVSISNQLKELMTAYRAYRYTVDKR